MLLERKDLAILIDPTGAAIGVQHHGGIEGPDIGHPEAVPLPVPEPPMDMGGIDMGMPDIGGLDF